MRSLSIHGPSKPTGDAPEGGDYAIVEDGQIIAETFHRSSPKHVHDALANAQLFCAAPDLLEALHEGRRAIGEHSVPSDCYATGPMTGDRIRDLVQCPACCFIAMYDAAIARATGEQA